MRKGYNELVGVQATFSKVTNRYSITMVYRWVTEGEMSTLGTQRSFDMKRFDPMKSIARCLREAYAAAVQVVWRRETGSSWEEYLQLKSGPAPYEFQEAAGWKMWAEW